MKFFNIDLHISVITDLKHIFTLLGHTIDDRCLSDHSFLIGRQKDHTRVINSGNWRQLNEDMCDAFYNEYKDELKDYDGFICTYPPTFALLYEKFNKPIIMYVPIRYEVPFHKLDESRIYGRRLSWFHDFLKRGIDSKQIIPIVNSGYEKFYCEFATGREWKYIPNICNYTGINWSGDGKDFILYSQANIECNHPNVKSKNDFLGQHYQWSRLNDARGIIHIPYNISTMSIFEQYTGNIPLLFPTVSFLKELHIRGIALQELTWGQVALLDYTKTDWLNGATFYDREWFPHIQYFNNFTELKNLIETGDFASTHVKMKEHNKIRIPKIVNEWKIVLDNLKR